MKHASFTINMCITKKKRQGCKSLMVMAKMHLSTPIFLLSVMVKVPHKKAKSKLQTAIDGFLMDEPNNTLNYFKQLQIHSKVREATRVRQVMTA